MRNPSLLRFLIVIFVVTILIGCVSNYPLGIKDSEWQALSPDKQAELRQTQATIERYQADKSRCRQKAVIKVKTQVPLGGFTTAEGLDVEMGVNQERYEACLRRAGWSEQNLRPIVNWIDAD
jgi:hypothetical protein